jgi:hypothetical protein
MMQIARGRRALRVSCRHAVLLVGLVSAGVAPAASAQSATLEARVSGADTVVVAAARSVSASWRENEHGDRIIVSRFLLDVSESLKGVPARTMWVDVDGGTLDGFTLRVSGLHLPEVGERAVFILDPGDGGVRTLHRRGLGILPLDDRDNVRGTAINLSEIRTRVRGQGR